MHGQLQVGHLFLRSQLDSTTDSEHPGNTVETKAIAASDAAIVMSIEPTPSDQISAEPPTAPPQACVVTVQPSPPDTLSRAERLVAEGKKAIALKQWEEGVGKYADALDLMCEEPSFPFASMGLIRGRRQLVGDFDPQMAPLLLSYGRALYELAFAQQGVMGKEEVDKQTDDSVRQAGMDDRGGGASSSNFVFSADPTSDDGDDEADHAGAGDITIAETAAGDGDAEGDGADEVDEPEDDYNAAWEVLDVARTIYAKSVDGLKEGEGREERLCLAECYLALGDVSCETENFPQAVSDYSSALGIKATLLPPSSRALASVHYQLATVLEFTPDRRPDALSHVQQALSGFKARLAELRSSAGSDELVKLGSKEKEGEIRDVEGLIQDLEVKIEELKAAPEVGDIVRESISHLMGEAVGQGVNEKEDGPVNDLTGMVKKKVPKRTSAMDGKGKGVETQSMSGKQAMNGKGGEEVNGDKRKVENENGEDGSAEKRAKLE